MASLPSDTQSTQTLHQKSSPNYEGEALPLEHALRPAREPTAIGKLQKRWRLLHTPPPSMVRISSTPKAAGLPRNSRRNSLSIYPPFESISEGAVKGYRVYLKSLKAFFEGIMLTKITAKMVEEYRDHRRQQLSIRYKGRTLKGATVNRELECLTCVLDLDAPGHRAAHSSAASMEGSSRMMNPASCSFVSA
jgi:Phage integrase SAM-like domain